MLNPFQNSQCHEVSPLGKERFGRYFHKKKNSGNEEVRLLQRMSALEPYPSDTLMGEKDQYLYAEVKKYIFVFFFYNYESVLYKFQQYPTTILYTDKKMLCRVTVL